MILVYKMRLEQTQKNFLFNIINLLVSVAIGFYYTPYLVDKLGVAAYGIVPIALIINQYINVLTGSLNSALTRFYSIALQQIKYRKASAYISTSLVVFIVLTLLLLPFLIYFIRHIDTFFNMPMIILRDVQYLFVYTLLSFFLSLYSSTLNITLYANNRLDLLNIIKILRLGLKFGLTVCLFELIDINVAYVGLAGALTELFILIISVLFFIKETQGRIAIRMNMFSKTAFVSIGVMASWTIIHQLGDVSIYRIDNLIVNTVWNSSVSGTLGAISEFGTYVTMIVSVIGSLFGPLILIAYSRKDHEQVQRLVLDNVLIVGVVNAIIVGLLIGYARDFLVLWLDPSFGIYSSWFILKLLPLPFFAAAGIYAFSNRAWNIVKYPALMTLLLGGINFIVMLSVAKYGKNNCLETIFVMLSFSALVVIIQSYGINSFFFLRTYANHKRDVLLIAVKIIAVIVVGALIPKCISLVYVPKNMIELIALLVGAGICMLIAAYLFLFSVKQKQTVLSIIKL